LRLLDDTRGVVQWPIVESVSSGETPGNLKLERKMGSSGIRFAFGSTAIKSVEIYDIAGQILVKKSVRTGEHEITLDGRVFSKGLYFVRYETSTGSVRRRVLIQ
jgi:hypothetical protein